MIRDRPYQTNVVAELLRATARFRRIIIVASTRAGKTIIAATTIGDYVRRYKKVLVLAHRREIVRQTRAKLRELGVWCGVIQAGADRAAAVLDLELGVGDVLQ